MAKLTPFGKEARRLRTEWQQTQSDIARALDVSVAFWSSIEVGKKNIPQELLDRLVAHFELSPHTASRLRQLAEISRPEVKINMREMNDPTRSLAVGFARKFENGTLSPEQLKRLQGILDED